MRLESIPILSTLDGDTLARVVVRRRYRAGEWVFRQGEPTTGLWVVLEGRLAMERVGAGGNVATVGLWVAGDVVGIAGLWDGSGYPASARVLDTPTEVGWIERRTVLDLHARVPAFGLAISRTLAERLRSVQALAAHRQGRPLGQQLAAILVMLHRRMGSEVRLTHEDLAHMVGTHRETVSRVVAEFVRQGWVETGYGAIRVRNLGQLAAYAGLDDRDQDS
ncbi:MAG: Crp/Fnr family transcriptional regulator [Firmicutes bacterium]|nr:Crp/Fnr family transcriptional regulator [Alicyclobacillaceae bacterium]MCL6497632.1 Crp/Fnr family transcriptional regulator [Bacillota bacterium]